MDYMALRMLSGPLSYLKSNAFYMSEMLVIVLMIKSYTVCFLKTVSLATRVLTDRYIVFIKIVYTEGTVFMKPAVL